MFYYQKVDIGQNNSNLTSCWYSIVGRLTCAKKLNTWSMGKVVKVVVDKKGLVRRVQVQTRSNILERPIDKLVLLLEADSVDE
jgi:hypothetical protein